MARVPLTTTEPVLKVAEDQLTTHRQAWYDAMDDVAKAREDRDELISDTTATKASADKATKTLKDARAACDVAYANYETSRGSRDDSKAQVMGRRRYLATCRNKRSPPKQLDSFPEACGVDLPTVMAYLAEEVNAILSDVPSGSLYWQLSPPASLTTTDKAVRTIILRQKEKLRINLRRWINHKAAFGKLYDRLTAAHFTFARATKA